MTTENTSSNTITAPAFNQMHPDMRVKIDQIFLHAHTALEWMTRSEDMVPPEMRPLVAGVSAALEEICGLTSDDADLPACESVQ